VKLFLKGTRCDTPKCAIERRDTAPGMHQFRRGKQTDYALHLREKQKVKHYYGVLERQFRGYFGRATRTKGNTGNALMSLLERRLDNVVHRLGFGLSRAQARQLVSHGHITVNGRRVNVASYRCRVGDVVEVQGKAKQLALVLEAIKSAERDVPDYVEADHNKMTAKLTRIPALSDVPFPVHMEPNLVVEFYSR